MMRRSYSLIHHLEFTRGSMQKDRRSTSVVKSTLVESPLVESKNEQEDHAQDHARDSVLIDAGTQTDVRSKGDGSNIDSPTTHLKNVNTGNSKCI